MKIITTAVALFVISSLSGVAGNVDQFVTSQEALVEGDVQMIESSSSEYISSFASSILVDEQARVVESLNLVPIGCKYFGGAMNFQHHAKVCANHQEYSIKEHHQSDLIVALN